MVLSTRGKQMGVDDGLGDSIRIFMVAGEPSGDSIGGKLMASLKKLCPPYSRLQFGGVGGALMEKQGLKSIFPMSDISVMGLVELIKSIPKIKLRIHQAVAAAEEFQPDIIVTIDAKGFSFRVLEGIRNCYAAKGQRRPPCVHYVSPSVWAYKNGAASLSKLKSIVDHVLCILAFEPALYKSSGVQATFVGHPALEDVWRNQDSDALIGSEDCLMSPPWRIKADGSDILASHGFQVRTPGSSPVVCVLPGSREQEVHRMLPIYRDALNHLQRSYKDLRAVVPVLSTSNVKSLVGAAVKDWHVPAAVIEHTDDFTKYEIFSACDAAMATSGTVVLQLLMSQLPCVVAYRAHWITEKIARHLAAVSYISIPNILVGREFIKEFVFEHCTPKNLASATSELLDSRRDPCQPHASDDDSELVLGALGPNVMFSADDAGLLEENDCTTTCHPVNSSVPQAHCYDGWMERASPSLRHYLYYEARRLDDLAEESSPQVGQHPWRRVWNKAHLDFGVEGGIGQLRRRQHSLGTMAKQNPTNFSVRAHEGTLVVNHGPPPFWSPVAVPRPSLLAAQVVFQMLFRKRLRI